MILDPSGRPASTGLVGNEPPPKLDVRVGTLVDIGGASAEGLPLVVLKFRCLVAFLEQGGKRAILATRQGVRPDEVTVVIPEPEVEALLAALTKSAGETTEEPGP